MIGAYLSPYDPDARCPKCGHDDVGSSYCTMGGAQYRHNDFANRAELPQWDENEHIDRMCRRCRYQWVEAVATTVSLRDALRPLADAWHPSMQFSLDHGSDEPICFWDAGGNDKRYIRLSDCKRAADLLGVSSQSPEKAQT